MRQNVLLFCDSEADYAQQMSTYLTKDKSFPWIVVVCTKKEEMDRLLDERFVQILVVAESFVKDSLPAWPADKVLILNESGRIHWPAVKNIDKYQEADCVRRELMKLSAKQEILYPTLNRGSRAVCVAFYSPVRRCLQTGLAIAYGQFLAEKKRVLYLNFEYYSTLWEAKDEDEGCDMTALLCYGDDNGFGLQLQAIRKSIGNWDYVAPMENAENLTIAEAGDWHRLIEKCRMLPEYDVIILDLNDSLQGLFELLKQSDRIFTVIKGDELAQKKLRCYEHMLEKKGCGCVLDKTQKVLVPAFHRLPERLEDYGLGELADFVKNHLFSEEENGLHRAEEGTSE